MDEEWWDEKNSKLKIPDMEKYLNEWVNGEWKSSDTEKYKHKWVPGVPAYPAPLAKTQITHNFGERRLTFKIYEGGDIKVFCFSDQIPTKELTEKEALFYIKVKKLFG